MLYNYSIFFQFCQGEKERTNYMLKKENKNLLGQKTKMNTLLTIEQVTEIINKLEKKTRERWKHYVLAYFISENGNVYTSTYDRLMTPQPNDKGYLYIMPCCNGKYGRKSYIHRLVLALFGDPEEAPNHDPIGALIDTYGKYAAHHVDGNITHNTPDNLVWIKKDIHDTLHRRLASDLIQPNDIDNSDKARAYAAEIEREKHYNDLLKQYGIM